MTTELMKVKMLLLCNPHGKLMYKLSIALRMDGPCNISNSRDNNPPHPIAMLVMVMVLPLQMEASF